MRISDWSSDVCSSDLLGGGAIGLLPQSGGLQHAAEDRIFQRPPGADGNTGQWIVRDGNRKPRLVAQLLIQAFQQRASAGQHNALIDNVSRKLRRGIFQRDAYTTNGSTSGRERVCQYGSI